MFRFDDDALRAFARKSATVGAIDRIVPFGQALAFDRFWDGFDIIASLTRTVRIDAGHRTRRP